MAKFCIFCGQPPVEKNKEHVIPRWLIELTGDPKRRVRLGLEINTDRTPNFREFAFDQFTFPACEECNTKHSVLESSSKEIIAKTLGEEPISGIELSTLLNWFDKVRVGLWLAFQQLNKNILSIKPQFHIEKRIGQFDRLLFIEKINNNMQHLSFVGADTLVFAMMPSAFTLLINNYSFMNISSLFLFSRRLGFPFPGPMQKLPDTMQMRSDIFPARERIMRPVLKQHIRGNGLKIFQPMFGQDLQSERCQFYENEYVKCHSYDHLQGIGAIFIEKQTGEVKMLGPDEKIQLSTIPKESKEESIIRITNSTLEWQNYLLSHSLRFDFLDLEQRRRMHSKIAMVKEYNNAIIAHHLKLVPKGQHSRSS